MTGSRVVTWGKKKKKKVRDRDKERKGEKGRTGNQVQLQRSY